MSIPLQALIDNPKLLDEMVPKKRCAKCSTVLHNCATGENKSSLGTVCDDCYYGMMGKEIERHPICRPRIRRG